MPKQIVGGVEWVSTSNEYYFFYNGKKYSASALPALRRKAEKLGLTITQKMPDKKVGTSGPESSGQANTSKRTVRRRI